LRKKYLENKPLFLNANISNFNEKSNNPIITKSNTFISENNPINLQKSSTAYYEMNLQKSSTAYYEMTENSPFNDIKSPPNDLKDFSKVLKYFFIFKYAFKFLIY